MFCINVALRLFSFFMRCTMIIFRQAPGLLQSIHSYFLIKEASVLSDICFFGDFGTCIYQSRMQLIPEALLTFLISETRFILAARRFLLYLLKYLLLMQCFILCCQSSFLEKNIFSPFSQFLLYGFSQVFLIYTF